MPTQALVRYISKAKVEQLVEQLGMEGKLVVDDYPPDMVLVRCGKDSEELKSDESASRAKALQTICDHDSVAMPKPPAPTKKASTIVSDDSDPK